jgi:hypothetical protein
MRFSAHRAFIGGMKAIISLVYRIFGSPSRFTAFLDGLKMEAI